MKYSGLMEQLSAEYISRNLESSTRMSYQELGEKENVEQYFYDELPNIEVKGYPFASDYVDKEGNRYTTQEFEQLSPEKRKECRLRFYYLPKFHELYVGTTGSGKTTGCLEPQIRAISYQKNKPHLFITDPKGELFEHNARHLREQGYRTYILNFKDFTRSDKWNPFLELYEKKKEQVDLGKDYKNVRGVVTDTDLIPFSSLSSFNGRDYIEYDGRAFASFSDLQYYVSIKKSGLDSEISSLVNGFAQLIVTKDKRAQDPTWSQGAQNLYKGILLWLVDEAFHNGVQNPNFLPEMMTLSTAHELYGRLRADFVDVEDREKPLETHELMKGKPRSVFEPMRTALQNAPNTRRSYCGVFEDKEAQWAQGHIKALTAESTIQLDGDDPFAIFIVTRDYDKSDYTIAGMFIDWVYRQMLIKAEKSAKSNNNMPTTRTLHFLLDEFGNIPEIKDFENKIATARSRNIWFHLFVQSFEQLDLVYGAEKERVICDNCNAQIFLGSQSRITKERFSQECGKTTIPSIRSILNPNDFSVSQVQVLPVSELDLIKEGDVYIKRLYMPVIKSQFIRSYRCAENGDFKNFRDPRAMIDIAPANNTIYNDARHTYARIQQYLRPKY